MRAQCKTLLLVLQEGKGGVQTERYIHHRRGRRAFSLRSQWRKKKMVEKTMNKETSHRWWFDSHHTSTGSPWLQSTLAKLDKKTKSMLKLVEPDADSFAQRAEMYYKKRPELISMVEDFYRAHRSLAERYDQLKFDSGNRLPATFGLPFSTKHRPEKLLSVEMHQTYGSNSETYDAGDFAESEVDDPELDQIQVDEELEEIETPEEKKESPC
ncbi:hypothetical protein OIU84_012431 [Salix udensis]|uniref:NAB domain-containing protein n=1 Tax=Salix udensis TaxID=889485 RepID=A0AAD6NTM7_9ROSI|nr:hypothetical protein OIU84_012431 [Salix udensis]